MVGETDPRGILIKAPSSTNEVSGKMMKWEASVGGGSGVECARHNIDSILKQ